MSHIENRISEISRVLKPGGYVIIREHDCINSSISTLIDIEHCVFDTILSDLTKDQIATFVETYQANYKTKFEWTSLFHNVGLKYAHQNYPFYFSNKNATRCYYAMYHKQVRNSSPKHTIKYIQKSK